MEEKTITFDDVLRAWIDGDAVWVQLNDGRRAKADFCDYQRLRCATKSQRENFSLSRCGIHWPDVDEDLSFDGFFRD